MDEYIPITVVYEDLVSLSVIQRSLELFGNKFTISQELSGGGFGYIRKRIRNFNRAARNLPFLVVTDLDDKPCPVALIAEWFPEPMSDNMIFRIAVREVESWLLADRAGFAEFLGIAQNIVPFRPDEVTDPKAELLLLTRKCRRREVREDILPRDWAVIKQGPNYNGRLLEYVANTWDPTRAREASPSLDRMLSALDRFSFSYAP
ncbi:MAG: hypothetical protein AAF998_12495 [Bacteroidota bacterium]